MTNVIVNEKNKMTEINKKSYAKDFQGLRLGILGGGQLGRMLIQSAGNYNIDCIVMDPDINAPCKDFCTEFVNSNFQNFDDVYNFGKRVDLLTIEIEHVNVEALEKLEKEGLKIFPNPQAIKTVQDKGLQKEFFKSNNIPTADFILLKDKKDLLNNSSFLPAIQKLRKHGYDGKGVIRLENQDSISKAFEEPSVLEKLIDIKKEISIIVSRNSNGEIKTYPPIELKFHKEANLVDYLFSPAEISNEVCKNATNLSIKIAKSLNIVGLLAVEMFITKNDEILINEIAPRPHNSGHHTIEANFTSQFEQHLRGILNLPLGNTEIILPAVMINLLGEKDYNGTAKFIGIEEVLKLDGVYIHLYGKKYTKYFRKMGHITILDKDLNKAIEKANKIKNTVKVIS